MAELNKDIKSNKHDNFGAISASLVVVLSGLILTEALTCLDVIYHGLGGITTVLGFQTFLRRTQI